MASEIPVLPEVASTTVCPGLSSPRRSASSMMAIARRSFTEPNGLKNSHFTYIVTPWGTRVLEYATRALAEIESLKAVAADLNQDNRGTLAIATTHTQARYVLPPVVQAFRERYPEVELHLHQGTSEQIAEMVATDRVQLAIATGSDGLFPGLVLLPVYRWHRQVIVPRHHPLANEQKLTLQELAKYPLVTYVFSFSRSEERRVGKE